MAFRYVIPISKPIDEKVLLHWQFRSSRKKRRKKQLNSKIRKPENLFQLFYSNTLNKDIAVPDLKERANVKMCLSNLVVKSDYTNMLTGNILC